MVGGYGELIQPKRLYCKNCDVLLMPDFNLTCTVCGNPLTTCWWALLHNKDKVKTHCKDCKNRFWCWTQTPDNYRIPTETQARVARRYMDRAASSIGRASHLQ